MEDNNIKREFGLSSFSIDNGTSVFIITAMIVVFGILAYVAMPKEQFPEISLPTIYVNTIYPGNSPLDMENLITRPIEKELKTVKGVKKISSTSVQDVSAVIVEFNEDVEVKRALQLVKDAVDKSKNELPNDLQEDPQVLELDFSEIPIVEINISGDFEIDKLKEYAEYLEEEIEALPEVSKVAISGDVEREIQINCDPFKMASMQVTFGDIEGAIAAENMTMSGGDVLTAGYRRSLRVDGEFRNMEDIRNIIVKSEDETPIYLRDIAEVKDTYVERNSFARLVSGSEFLKSSPSPVLSLKVVKKTGQNLINADEKIQELLDEARKTKLPETLKIVLTNNQADEMKKQIANLENSIISGVILVVAVLLFFMGLRNALFVGVSIPLSMFLGFLILSLFGYTINIVVLFALILALGMLVDNAIVVIENIYRLMENGYSRKQAAKEGVGEVAVAIISSTATTLAAFVPLAFWGGLMGQFMKYLPVTLIIVLSSSLFVGLVINPVIANVFMKVDNSQKQEKWKRLAILGVVLILAAIPMYIVSGPNGYTIPNLLVTFAVISLSNAFLLKPLAYWFQNVFLVKLEKGYNATLRFALSGYRPYAVLASTFAILVLSLMIFGANQPKTILFPEADPQFVYVYVEAPLGTDVNTTNQITKEAEKRVYEVLKPYQHIIKSIVTNVGKETKDPAESMGGTNITPHRSKIGISFVPYEERGGISTSEVLNAVALEMKKIRGAKIVTAKNQDGPPTGKPVSIEVTGEDFAKLIGEAEKIKAIIERADIPGIDGLRMELETGKPEMLMTIDRSKARRYGLSTSMVAMNLRTTIFGKEISKYKDGEDDYPINLRMKDEFRYNQAAINDQVITFRDNRGAFHQVPISSIASVDLSSTYGEVKRKDAERMIVVSSNVLEGYNPNEVVVQIKSALSSHKLPEGYRFKFGGQQEEQAKSLAFLAKAMLIAVASIFLILVSQFNSLSKPFIIVGSVVFSLIGVFLGLSIFGDDFVIIMTGVGIISLAGVVVNNAIVLIDYTELTKKRRKQELGLSDDDFLPYEELVNCLAVSGYTRLRPVLLTAITTVLGLVPLAIGLNIDFFKLYASFNPDIYMGGENAAMWGPMAWTVIYGLTFATFLTLVVVPVMYLLTEQLKRMVKGVPKEGKAAGSPVLEKAE